MSTSLEIQMRPARQTKGQMSALRSEGWIPAVVYGGKKAPQTFSVQTKQFVKELSSSRIMTRVFHLEGIGAVLVKDMQFAIKDVPIHIDFLRLEEGESVIVSVPLKFINEDRSPGLKRGGVLNVIHYTIDLSVPATHIPQDLPVDLSGMEIGHTLHLQNITLPDQAKALHVQPDEAIVSVVAPSGLAESLKEGSA